MLNNVKLAHGRPQERELQPQNEDLLFNRDTAECVPRRQQILDSRSARRGTYTLES